MEFLATFALTLLNLGLTVGLVLGVLILLRPLLLRVLGAQQRVILWTVAWILAYFPTTTLDLIMMIRLLPVTFFDLITPRTSGFRSFPAFLPQSYDGAGRYNIALPGGTMVPVEMDGGWLLALFTILWLAGVAAFCWYDIVSSRPLKKIGKEGSSFPKDDPVLRELTERVTDDVGVYLCSGLPTSFVVRNALMGENWYTIYLQDDLPEERMHLVLRHEFHHIRLKHCLFKFFANVGVIFHWWNPVIWLGYRYFCRDMELACDEAVLRDLQEGERKEYAKTLVELGSGRQLWESPMAFGECDAALRVKAAVGWRPSKRMKQILTWGLTLLVAAFFFGGPRELYRGDDMEAYYHRYAAAQPEKMNETAVVIAARGGASIPVEVEQVWAKGSDKYASGHLYVQTEDGSWYRGDFAWLGRRPLLLRESDQPVEPPDLSQALRVK